MTLCPLLLHLLLLLCTAAAHLSHTPSSSSRFRPFRTSARQRGHHHWTPSGWRPFNLRRGKKAAPKPRNAPPSAKCGSSRLPSASRIAGGSVVTSSSRDHNVALFSGSRRCSGALIASIWVLTAAHCTLYLGDRVIIGGSSETSGSLRHVEVLHRHPRYSRDRTKVVNEIMLVRLDKQVNYTPVPLNSAAKEPDVGTVVRATGYGRDAAGKRRGKLKFIDVDVLSGRECSRKFRTAGYTLLSKGILGKYHLCANHDVCDAGVCFGDSGGPLVARDRGGGVVQVGVTSYGTRRCGSRETPDVYARVSLFRAWITKITKGKAKFVKLRAMR